MRVTLVLVSRAVEATTSDIYGDPHAVGIDLR